RRPRAPPRSSRTASFASAAPQPRGEHREKRRVAPAVVLEVMRQVRIERHAVALAQLIALAVADERELPLLDERGLAAAGLEHRRGHPASLGEVAQREARRLAQRLHARSDDAEVGVVVTTRPRRDARASRPSAAADARVLGPRYPSSR